MTIYEQAENGYFPARPSSKHPGGFLVTMCDGHTQFMSEDQDYRVYCMIMAPDNTNAKYTGLFGASHIGFPIVYPGTFNTSNTTAAPATGLTAIPLKPLTQNDLK